MANEGQSLDQISWLLCVIHNVLGILISGAILYKEVRKRQHETCTFSSNTLRFTSIVCMWDAVGMNVSLLLSIVPGFCMMDQILVAIASSIGFVSLGFYQLSRLHSSFSKDRIHSDKGYPLWLFKLMMIIGIVLILLIVVSAVIIDSHPAKCGFSARPGTFFFWENQQAIILDGMYEFCLVLVFLCVHMWDLVTLLLYIYKIWKIGAFYKSQDNDIWNSIVSILHRIVIITVFYQITIFLFIVMFYAVGKTPGLGDKKNIGYLLQYVYPGLSGSITASLSMYLMMAHNTNEYILFLRVFRKFHLHSICFCWCRHIVDRQLEEFEGPSVPVMVNDRSDAELRAGDTMRTQTNISADEQYNVQIRHSKSMSTLTRVSSNELDIPAMPTTRESGLRQIGLDMMPTVRETEYKVKD